MAMEEYPPSFRPGNPCGPGTYLSRAGCITCDLHHSVDSEIEGLVYNQADIPNNTTRPSSRPYNQTAIPTIHPDRHPDHTSRPSSRPYNQTAIPNYTTTRHPELGSGSIRLQSDAEILRGSLRDKFSPSQRCEPGRHDAKGGRQFTINRKR